MKQTIKALIILTIFAAGIVAIPLLLRNSSEESKTISIITTNFPGYDFARAVTKDVPDTEVRMLVSPGAELHDYEPTPGDIKAIEESSLFIYTGGESDTWVENILKNLNPDKVIKMMDTVTLIEEETVEGMESDDEEGAEYDEHVWTSPKNAKNIIEKILDTLSKLNPKNAKAYEQNAKDYLAKLDALDAEFKNLVDNAKRKEIIFGDRFPLRYFVEEYGLTYYAAFPGCSDQTEASARTVAFLIDRVKSDNIPVVFRTELSSGKIADEIAKSSNAKVLEFHSAHNVSKSDFDAGVTYLDLMERNLAALKEALN